LNPAEGKGYLIHMTVLHLLAQAGFSSYLAAPSAIQMYFQGAPGSFIWIETEGTLIDLSRLFESLTFPGSDYFDAALEYEDSLVLFHCIDRQDDAARGTATIQGAFWYDLGRRVYLDPLGAYPLLREESLVPNRGTAYPALEQGRRKWYPVAESALLAAGFGYVPDEELRSGLRAEAGQEGEIRLPAPGKARVQQEAAQNRLTKVEQRFLLSRILSGPFAAAGLEILLDSGFIDVHWPLLRAMNTVPHSKEHHPEGNVWKHTLETFSHRKVFDVVLSLGLLFHDCGKPFAREQNGNRFDRHAQIGAYKAGKFMADLAFPVKIIESVEFLVQYHMLPGAVSKLPVFRTEDIMRSPLFPDLLELYRCDISSTYRGPEGYYRACKAYRRFLKNSQNPFRDSAGKKRLRLLVE